MIDHELEEMKQINLVEYAASVGYTVDRLKSGTYSKALKNDDGDKIIVTTGQNNHSIYFSIRNDHDKGSIIDFIQHRTGQTIGKVRQELRRWLGTSPPLFQNRSDNELAKPLRSTEDRRSVILNYLRAAQIKSGHPYLNSRGIDFKLICDIRFIGRIRMDIYGNALFPHFDRNGLSGYEIKGRQFSGFSKGGEKGLWFSNFTPYDKRLLIAESAIDALSYHLLYGDDHTRYFSFGGSISPKQIGLLKGAIKKIHNQSGFVVCAFDNDEMGAKYNHQVLQIMTPDQRLHAKSHFPENRKDWNEMLKEIIC